MLLLTIIPMLQNNGPSVGFAVAGGVFLCIGTGFARTVHVECTLWLCGSIALIVTNIDAGNLLTQYALAFVGLSVTETVESSITVVMGALDNFSYRSLFHARAPSTCEVCTTWHEVLCPLTGTTLNFFLDGRINKAEILFPGVACFLFGAALIDKVQSPMSICH